MAARTTLPYSGWARRTSSSAAAIVTNPARSSDSSTPGRAAVSRYPSSRGSHTASSSTTERASADRPPIRCPTRSASRAVAGTGSSKCHTPDRSTSAPESTEPSTSSRTYSGLPPVISHSSRAAPTSTDPPSARCSSVSRDGIGAILQALVDGFGLRYKIDSAVPLSSSEPAFDLYAKAVAAVLAVLTRPAGDEASANETLHGLLSS
jgi:hypothetical protein